MWVVWNLINVTNPSFPLWFKEGRAETDAAGRFHMSGLPPGELAIASKHDRLKSPKEAVKVQLHAGETSRAKVVMDGRLDVE